MEDNKVMKRISERKATEEIKDKEYKRFILFQSSVSTSAKHC